MTPAFPHKAIFISIGSGLTPDEEGFVAAVESHLLTQGFSPVTIGRNTYNDKNPLEAIRTSITVTAGTLIIAFARMRILSAVEYPASEAPRRVSHQRLATVWNHIEAAMAYQAGKPLLVF